MSLEAGGGGLSTKLCNSVILLSMLISRLCEYVCPSCRSNELKLSVLTEGTDGNVAEGMLSCSACQSEFRISGGIPRFVPASNYADSFGFQWNRHATTQLDSRSGLPISRDRLWEVLGGATDLSGERILEAGSGAGRFTEVLATTGAEIFSFDYSTAVDANARTRSGAANVNFFQGDIFNIPLHDASFDKVICLGVLQHTPDPKAAFRSLSSYVRPGGMLAIDVYRKDVAAMLQWKYLLRPITRRMDKAHLYRLVERFTPRLVPVARTLRRFAGRAGARLVPIVEYSHLGLAEHLNVEWAVLDTFDMYSPAHDHPQSLDAVREWYQEIGFTDVTVWRGKNGVAARGRRPDATRPHPDGSVSGG